MNLQEAEKKYKDLKAQHLAGKLNDAAFEAEAGKLRLQDAQGRWWQIGVQTGEWYMHDGQKWNKAKPPAIVAPPSAPAASPEAPTAPKVGAPAAAAPAAKPARASALPARLFSAKPAGRGGGGLSKRALIGIIVVVALLGVAILVGAYLLISGALSGGTAKATATPTRAVAGLPSPVIPTLAPPVRATDTPLPPPIPVVTATIPLMPTVAPPRATATKTPATPAGPAPTPTPNIPPGLYVTKVQTDPAQPNFNEPVGFRVTFFNNTGGSQIVKWLVKIYQCEDRGCSEDNFRRSIGESTTVESNVGTGSVELVAPKHWATGVGACNFVARAFYFDANSNVVEFLKTDGSQLYHNFSMCR